MNLSGYRKPRIRKKDLLTSETKVEELDKAFAQLTKVLMDEIVDLPLNSDARRSAEIRMLYEITKHTRQRKQITDFHAANPTQQLCTIAQIIAKENKK